MITVFTRFCPFTASTKPGLVRVRVRALGLMEGNMAAVVSSL